MMTEEKKITEMKITDKVPDERLREMLRAHLSEIDRASAEMKKLGDDPRKSDYVRMHIERASVFNELLSARMALAFLIPKEDHETENKPTKRDVAGSKS